MIECEELPVNYKNGKIITPNGTFFGSDAELLCPRGYKPDGPHIVTCTSSGQWSGPIAGCVQDENATTPIPITQYSKPTTTKTVPTRRTSISTRLSTRTTAAPSTAPPVIKLSNNNFPNNKNIVNKPQDTDDGNS